MIVSKLSIPKEAHIEKKSDDTNTAEVVVEPLERGWGYTLGNSFRRILLAYVPGAAVSSVRIEGAPHEFSTIQGVKEDVSEIILNVKQLSVRLLSQEEAMLHLEASGEGDIKASDIEPNSDVEIVNKDLHIATINSDSSFKMEMRVSHGRGYVPAEKNKKEDDPEGIIAIDSIFSPITKVNYIVENTRVGQRTDLDRLLLQIKTDGTIEVEEAMKQSAEMLNGHLRMFLGQGQESEQPETMAGTEKDEELKKVLETSVDDLELPSRAHNCLKAANIHSLGDLVRNSESEMLKYKNFGRKSLNEIKEILDNYGIHFGMNVDEIVGTTSKDNG